MAIINTFAVSGKICEFYLSLQVCILFLCQLGMSSGQCRARCDDGLRIINLQPFNSGCTLVQWSDTSPCSADNDVNYTLEILQSCSDQMPSLTMKLTNSTSTSRKTRAFNTSMHNIMKPFLVRVKAESAEECWRSRCYTVHRDLRVNTTCMHIAIM